MKPIQVDFKPSVIFIGVIISVSFVSCLTLMLMPLAWQIKLPIVLAILIVSVYTILHYGLLSMPSSIVGLQVNINNELYIERKDGEKSKVRVAANTMVMPHLAVMNFHEPNTAWYQRIFNQAIIVLPDSTDLEAFRQLRVWLRWANMETNSNN